MGVNRNYRVWSHSILSCVLLSVCVLLFNAAITRVDVRADLTEEGLYTLSESSVRILGKLRDPVSISVFWGNTPPQAEPGRRYVEGLLEEMQAAAGDKLSVRWIDTDTDAGESEAAELNLNKYMFNRKEGNKQVQSVGYMTMRVESGDQPARTIDTLAFLGTRLEYEILADLDKRSRLGAAGVAVANPDSPLLSQAMGPRSPPGRFTRIKGLMKDLYGTEMRELSSLDDPVPDDVQVLVLLAPWNLGDLAVYHVDQFVVRGGRLLLLLDNVNLENTLAPGQEREPRSSGLEAWLSHVGVTAEYGLVGDFGSRNRGVYEFIREAVGPYPYFPIISRENTDTSNVVMESLEDFPMCWPSALRADMVVHDDAGRTVSILATTSPEGHLRPEIGNVGETIDFAMPRASELEAIPVAMLIEGPLASMWKGQERPLSEAERIEKEQADSDAAARAAGGDGDDPAPPGASGDPDGGDDSGDDDGEPGAGDSDDGAPDDGAPEDDAPDDEPEDPPGGGDEPGDDAEPGNEDDDAPAETGPPRFNDGDVRIVILSDAELVADYMGPRRTAFGEMEPTNGLGGYALIVNMTDWLRGSEDLIGLRSRDTNPRRIEVLDEGDEKWIKLLNLTGVPFLLLCIGLVVFAVRRSQR